MSANMKPIRFRRGEVLAIVALALALQGCGGGDETEDSLAPPAAATAEVPSLALPQVREAVNLTEALMSAVAGGAKTASYDPFAGWRITVYWTDGRLARIEEEIARTGYADVEIAQNLENFDFDLGRDGRILHRPSAAQAAEIALKRPALLGRLPARGILDLAAARAAPRDTPMFPLRVNREGYLAVIEHDEVRGVRLASAQEVERPSLDEDVLSLAQKHGSVRVSIDLQRFSGYSPYAGKLPEAASRTQDMAVRRAFDELLQTLDADSAATAVHLGGIASVFVTLSLPAVRQLFASPDPRILNVRVAKGEGTGASISIQNFPNSK